MKNSQKILTARLAAVPPRYRPSFTLIELLVVVGIIGIMSSMVLFTLAGAQNEARAARTRGTIQKINEIILQKWEEYRYKPVDVRLPPQASAPIPGSQPPRYPVSPRDAARLRMTVLRDTMRMEMPDRITDLLYEPSQYTVAYRNDINDATSFAGTKIERAIPHGFALIYDALRTQINTLRAQGHPRWTNGLVLNPLPINTTYPAGTSVGRYSSDSDANWSNAVQSGELLYLLVATSQYGGASALEYFRPSEVGDPDEDGLLEFLDAWGESIAWIRWPAGYPGDLVRYADADAMDPLKTDWRYRPGIAADWQSRTLVPLILSAGNDQQFGVTFDFAGSNSPPIAYATMTWPGGTSPNGTDKGAYYQAGPYYYPDPFFTFDYQSSQPNGPNREIPYPDDVVNFPRGYRANQIGSIPAGAAALATDNITNHDIILEP